MILWGMAPRVKEMNLSCSCLLGLGTIGQGMIKNFEGLVAMRVVVGLFEAGLFP